MNRKKTLGISFQWLLLLLLIGGLDTTLNAQVKIGDNPTEINPYVILEIESQDKAVLLPRMSSAQRDAVFSKNAPEGAIIFNTDNSKLQIFHRQIDPITGTQIGSEMVWEDVLTETVIPVQNTPPAAPIVGEMYMDTASNTVHIYNGEEWMLLNSGSQTTPGSDTPTGSNPVMLTGTTAPSATAGATALEIQKAGSLYANVSNGYLYVAADRDGNGTADSWVRLRGPSGSDGSNGVAGVPGSTGPAGPQGPAGSNGKDGKGVLIGTASPPTSAVDSPTLYVNSSTGELFSNEGGGSTWNLLPQSGIDSGTLMDATLRWDGTAWVQNSGLTASVTNTNINVSNNISLTAGNQISLTATTSLGGRLLDNNGAAGTAGQVLTVSGTQVLWQPVSETGIASGTADFTTLHWAGNDTGWVENTYMTAGATNTTIDVNNTIRLEADNAISLTSTNTTVNASNNINLSADNAISLTATTTIQGGRITANATGNANISATETLTLAAGNTIALTTTASVDSALLDSTGSPGENGQVLASTSTQTTWITLGGNTVTQTTTDYTASVDDGTIVALPAAAITITLPSLQAADTGKILTIKRGNAYTIDNSGAPVNPLELVTSGGSTIDGINSLKLNLSYQGYTIQALAGNWVIIQRF